MHRKDNLARLILAIVVALVLNLLMVVVETQAQIAFRSEREGHFINDTGITSEIYVMDADGKNQRRFANNRRNDDTGPSWAPDGKRIVFTSTRNGDAEIYVMDADGGNPKNLTKSRHHDYNSAWFGPALAVAPAGKMLRRWGWLKQVDR